MHKLTKRRIHNTVSVLVAMFTIAIMCSCATMDMDLTKMSAEDVGAMAMTVYTSNFEYHQSRAGASNLSDKERVALQDLKGALENVYPYIQAYNTTLDGGLKPSALDRQALMNFIRQYYYKE